MRRALLVTPTPSHPTDHGNRNRVRQMLGLITACDFAVDILLYPIDDDFTDAIPDGLDAMAREAGGMLTIVPPSRPLHQPPDPGPDHAIDAWWDNALDPHLAYLCRRRDYAVMWVNYVFLSAAFQHAPPGCLRVLDTHDALAGRRALFERHGARAEFFHTTEAGEAIGLARADVVVAIKASEAAAFRRRGAAHVVTIPAVPEATARPRMVRDGATLRAGFIGADNQVNALGLARLLERLASWRRVFLPDLMMVVAGGVSRRVTPIEGQVEVMGPIASVDRFYHAIDVAVAPTIVSTGLKVKVAEALAHGVAVIATADAFDGFAPAHPWHALPDIDALCQALVTLAMDRTTLAPLVDATQRCAAAIRAAEADGVAILRGLLLAPRRRIAVVTDKAFAERATLAQERSWQAIDYLSTLHPVTIIAVGVPDPAAAAALPPSVETIAVPTADAAGAVLSSLAAAGGLAACMLALGSASAPPLPDGVLVLRDRWHAFRAARRPFGRDLVLDDGTAVAAIPLRHLPARLHWRDDRARSASLLILVEGTDEPAVIARLTGTIAMSSNVVHSVSIADDANLIDRLAALPTPRAIVTIGAEPASRGLITALGTWVQAGVFHLGDAPYPLRIGDELITNLAAHIEAIAAWLRDGRAPLASQISADAGWSTLWARLARRQVAA